LFSCHLGLQNSFMHLWKQLQHFCYQNILSSSESDIFQLCNYVKVGQHLITVLKVMPILFFNNSFVIKLGKLVEPCLLLFIYMECFISQMMPKVFEILQNNPKHHKKYTTPLHPGVLSFLKLVFIIIVKYYIQANVSIHSKNC
jgi:hypothetical protein